MPDRIGIALPEEWRPIPRYGDRYEASNLGRIRSLLFVNGQVSKKRDAPLVLAATPCSGYPAVSLATGRGRWVTEHVHRLVLEAFVGPCPSSRHEAAHEDGDRNNARLDNLSWKTFEENESDKIRHGTDPQGERNPFARLSDADVIAIRERHAAGESGRALAAAFGVTATQISRIVLRQSWTHLPATTEPRRKFAKPTGYVGHPQSDATRQKIRETKALNRRRQ